MVQTGFPYILGCSFYRHTGEFTFQGLGKPRLCVARLQQEAVFSALPLEGNAQAVPVTQYPWLGGEL